MQMQFDESRASDFGRVYTFLGVATAFHDLKDTWERVNASGVLERRGLLRCSLRMRVREQRSDQDAAEDARTALRGLRSCALAGCGARETNADRFKRCATCKSAAYCCRAHQVEAWPAHKKECKDARKAAAEAAP
jgi:hypothetical protein